MSPSGERIHVDVYRPDTDVPAAPSISWSPYGKQQAVHVQPAILSICWPVLYLVTVLQTLFLLKKPVRRQRGFTV